MQAIAKGLVIGLMPLVVFGIGLAEDPHKLRSADAAQYGDYHKVIFRPYGSDTAKVDDLRVAIPAKSSGSTYCDFERYNRYDAKLIGIANGGERGSLQSCVPGKILFLER